ncbi:MAG TPA: methionyl-tRNA formyltransferase [Bacillota bacterium]
MDRREHDQTVRGQPLPIYQYSVPEQAAVLRRVAEPVRRITRSIARLLDDMLATMYAADGVGLAAPQVGVSKRIIVVDVGDGPIELINPELTRAEGSEVATEGCLSIPELVGEVERAARVVVTGLDRHGRKRWVEGEGLLARALQHEIDHLNGVLFTDRARRVFEVPREKRLKIVYMGTPDFSVPVLATLVHEGYRVRAVVTQPDRPRGRGQRLQPTPVKRFAEEVGLRVLQPERMRDPAFLAELRQLQPDVILTCAFGKILPAEVLTLPALACLNVHASLLPKYRGAAPIQHAILAGEHETGITIFYMDEGMDTGDILLQRRLAIEPEDTAGTLHDKLSSLAARVVPEALRLLVSDEPPRTPQDEAQASYAPRLGPEDERIHWDAPATAVVNRIRALDPAPGAHCLWRGRLLKLFGARLAEAAAPGRPGEIVEAGPGGLVVAGGDGWVSIGEVQPAGARRMPVADFLNGYRVEPGERLE